MIRVILGSLAAVGVAGILACGGGTAVGPAATGPETAGGPASMELPVPVRELAPSEKLGRRFRSVVVPPGIDRDTLIVTANILHAQDPDSSIRFFDDAAKFPAFQAHDEHYATDGNGADRHDYPGEWAEAHYLAFLDPAVTPDGLEWRLSAVVPGGLRFLASGAGTVGIADFETVDSQGRVIASGDDLSAVHARVAAAHQKAEREGAAQRQLAADAAEWDRLAREEQQLQAAEQRERDAANELAELLAAADVATVSRVESCRARLDSFASRYADTAAGSRARSESGALADLVKARTGADVTVTLRSVVEKHPGTLAAEDAALLLPGGSP